MIAATPTRNRPRPLLLALALAAMTGLSSGGFARAQEIGRAHV